jgi:peptidyl-dipeptidase A
VGIDPGKDKIRVMLRRIVITFSLVVSFACSSAPTATAPPTAAEATAFLEQVDARLLDLGVASAQAGWVQQNFITADTEAVNARLNKDYIEAAARYAKEATRFGQLSLPPDQRRQLDLLRLSLVMAAPSDGKEAAELTTIAARMDGA